MLLYVDDAEIAAPNQSIIDGFVSKLRDLGFDLEIEGNFNSYLDIGIEELYGGTYHMVQKCIIKQVIQTTKIENCNPNWTPSTQVALGSDPVWEPYDQSQFNYASIVGMLHIYPTIHNQVLHLLSAKLLFHCKN